MHSAVTASGTIIPQRKESHCGVSFPSGSTGFIVMIRSILNILRFGIYDTAQKKVRPPMPVLTKAFG